MKDEFCKCYATHDMYECQYLEWLVYAVYGLLYVSTNPALW